MTETPHDGLIEAMRLTNAGRLTEATAALQRMLKGLGHAAAPSTGAGRMAFSPEVGAPAMGARPALPEALRGVLLDQVSQISHGGLQLPGGGLGGLSPAAPRVPVPDGARFLAATFSEEAGSRPYKLYVPSGYRPRQPVPLVVMLHGCTQSPDDFAAGTRMNEAAEEHTCLIVYPGQTASANVQRCWNWFSEGDQHRGQGEPALIAGITRQVMRDYAVDPRHVYVAGLSAGGAAAAIMGDTYPDLYAAIGVHSGLACGAASDMPSAFAAMRGGGAVGTSTSRSQVQRRIVPAIVFHGDRDTTVNPQNGDAVVAQSARGTAPGMHTEEGKVPGGHAFSRRLRADASGRTVIEQWVVHGAGHAWFGGSPAGSYTDPHGPDATCEMLRFFLEHPHPAPAQAA